MGREFMKPLTFEEYLYFYRETLAKDLNTKQLKEILSMHGFQKLTNHHKDEIFSMVRCLHLISPTRSTIHGGNAQLISTGAKSAPSLEELKKDIRDTEWQECPVGSIETVDPAALAVAGGMGDNLSSVTSNFSVPRGPDKKKGGVIRKRNRRNNLKKQEAIKIIYVASSNLNNIDDHRWLTRELQYSRAILSQGGTTSRDENGSDTERMLVFSYPHPHFFSGYGYEYECIRIRIRFGY